MSLLHVNLWLGRKRDVVTQNKGMILSELFLSCRGVEDRADDQYSESICHAVSLHGLEFEKACYTWLFY